VSPPTALRPSSRPWHDLGPFTAPPAPPPGRAGPAGPRKVIRSSGSSGGGPGRVAAAMGRDEASGSRGPSRSQWTAPGAQRRRRCSGRAAAGRPFPLRRPALQLEQDARADVSQRHTYSGSGPEFPSTDAPRRQQIAMWGHPPARRTMHGQRWVRTEGGDRCDAPEVRSPFDAIDKGFARGRRDMWLHQLVSIVVQGSRGSWLCPSLMISRSRAILAPTYQTAR
jgi:hypothetical protein